MIKLENVTKFYRYKDDIKYVLKDVTFTIPENKNVAILGRNGAGKSTLLRILGGIDYPNKGKVISDKSFSWPVGLSGGLQGSLSARDNVKFVARIYGQDDKDIKRIVKYVEEFCELGHYFDLPLKLYSSGMRSRVGFGISLAFDFDYMLIDEALSVGDKIFKKKAKKALFDKIERSNILIVSHSMDTLKELCDVGILANDGNLTYFDDVDDAIRAYNNLK
ncbi:MAG: ABC transporter ATP-binding protein [Campylobacterota bacterium]|nr:ABC transporter ATP-binding protein [Campylobacterota bacterium]